MKDNISDVLSKLDDRDVYSVICGFLYDLRDDPKYSVISELVYMCDQKSFMNLIKYLSGTSIKIPTAAEFSDCINTLLLFHYYEIEHKSWKEAIELSGYNNSTGKKAHNKLDKLKETLTKYNYGNRNY